MSAVNLCVECGLCCSGSLFAEVELSAREAARVELLGMALDDSECCLVQPCGALNGRRCGVYEFRPQCCRTFECRTLQEMKRGAISVTEAQARIAEALRAVARVESLLTPNALAPLQDRCEDALGAMTGKQGAELEKARCALDRIVERNFLGPRAAVR